MNRTWAWLVVSPVVCAGVLTAHDLAYRLTSASTEPLHGYLEHAPQILLLLAGVGVLLASFGGRLHTPPARTFPLAAVATFVLQEHVERLVHGASFPFLLTSPTFLVGLALQIPVALVAWALARWLLSAVQEVRRPRPARIRLVPIRLVAPTVRLVPIDVRVPPGRGPPRLS